MGVVSGDTVTLTGTAIGTFASKDVGSNITVGVSGLAIGGAKAGDYVLTLPTGLNANITQATLTVSGITANNRVYDSTTAATLNAASAAPVGVFSGDTVTLTGTAVGAFASKDVGSNITVSVSGLTISGAQASDYTLTSPTTTANITPATLTASGITSNNKVYDGTTVATLTVSDATLYGIMMLTAARCR